MYVFSHFFIFMHTHRDIVDLVLDHHNKANIIIKQIPRIFFLPVYMKVMLHYSLLGMQ